MRHEKGGLVTYVPAWAREQMAGLTAVYLAQLSLWVSHLAKLAAAAFGSVGVD